MLRTLGAGALADGEQRYSGHAYQDALTVAHEKHVTLVKAHAGLVWSTDDGVALRFLGPREPLIGGTRNDINENSVVFMLEYRRPACARSFKMLFTGDAGAAAEQRLLASGADLKADVLKVGHHGSAYGTTPEFVRAVAPKYAIISACRDNLFGHPAPTTLETLQQFDTRLYRTDENGAISISSDGASIAIQPML